MLLPTIRLSQLSSFFLSPTSFLLLSEPKSCRMTGKKGQKCWSPPSLFLLARADPQTESISHWLGFRNACERQEKQSWVKDNLVILKHSVLYTINFIIAYFIMLCVMTFNGGISISIFLGIFIGNFLFSRLNSSGLQCDVEEKVAGCH